MENQNRTLGSVINPSSQQGQGQDNDTQSYNTYLTVFAINCAHRFPDVSDIDNIDYDTVKSVAEFSAACSNIAVQTWAELQPATQQNRRSRLRRSVA